MILKNSSFEEFADHIISSDKRIVIFGAGMIGLVTASDIFRQFGIADRLEYYIDNDMSKNGTKDPLYGKMIYSPEYLSKCDPYKNVLVISISRYSDVIKQLKAIENIRSMECYILPMMCISNFKPAANSELYNESSSPLIPKVIHYMWLGRNKIPDTLQFCIDSWKKFCPDYQIIQWNEDNYDINKNLYMKQAYENKAYGFVPDYARLDILYEYGGIYLDTDVELKKSLDDMLNQSAFCCVEKWQTINFGGGSGAVKGSQAVGKLLEARKPLTFVNPDGTLNRTTCGYYDTLTLMKYGYQLNNSTQKVLDMTVLPYEYFHPYDYMSGRTELTDHTYGIHHFNGGWLDIHMKAANQKTSEEFEKIYAMAEKEAMI
ncbi:MAG: glycosyltransferase [Oscillospiraceae bacterium]|nr:glycosyltransferase [Oscillospiraceae bacterium]